MKKYFTYDANKTFSTLPAKIFFLALLLCIRGLDSYATAWTTGTAGDITVLSNWTNGSIAPVSFTTPGDTWTINKSMTIAASGAETWVLGSASPASPVTLTIASGGSLSNTGSITTATITIYGDLVITDGTLDVSGSICILNLTVDGNFTINGTGKYSNTGSQNHENTIVNGNLAISGSGTYSNASPIGYKYTSVNGALSMTSGTIDFTGSSATNTFTVTGADITFSGGTLTSSSTTNIVVNTGNFNLNNTAAINLTGSAMTTTVNGNFNMSGTSTWMCTSGIVTNQLNVNGNFSMTGTNTIGVTGGISSHAIVVKGNLTISGPSAMTNTASSTNTVHLALPGVTGTMLIDNTSTGTWSYTNVFVDTSCTAQLDGNFSTTTGAATFGVTVNGTLICPAAYFVNGAGKFIVNGVATLKVAHAGGINAAITTAGTTTFNTSANYVFNGSVAQVTGSYLPTALVAPDTITISNSAGVTLTASTATTGKLLFTSGILHTTSAFTMSTPGIATGVVGAGATSYVDGTLIKTISGLSSVNYEVGDLDYAPMNLAFSAAGTGGSLGIKCTNGLHPNVATSGIPTSNIANHYWTITNYSAAGPVTVTPRATYNLTDIIGGSNASFVTQEYAGAAWLSSALATTNTSTPYTSTPNAGISLGTLAGDYIFGNGCGSPIIGTTGLCTVGSTTALSDATPAGTWSSGSTTVATVTATGVVTAVSAGSATIFYNTASCSMSVVVTIGTLPITGSTTICTGSTSALSDATPGGVWSSSNTGVATVSATGVVSGVTSGTSVIVYTLGSCTVSATVTISGTLAAITGTPTTICAGATTTLSDATPGGTWSSSNTAVATVSGAVIVHGVSAGTANISYGLGSCSVIMAITVEVPGAGTITGKDSVCIGAGHIITLSDNVSGGVWSSSNTLRATVNPGTGVVTGVSTGAITITYTVINSCGTYTVTYAMYVRSALQCATGETEVTGPAPKGLFIFPNPNRGTFTMNLSSDNDEEAHVVIINIVGEQIREFISTTNKSVEIKLNSAAGVYLLSASTAHGRYIVKIVVD